MTTPDQPMQGSTADHCSAWPADMPESATHHLITHMRGGARVSVQRCQFCGWIDFDDLDRQVREQVAEGRRQVTEGWEREPSVRYPDGFVLSTGFTEAGARRTAEETGGTLVSRLVGPWEPAEQATPSCTCPMVDVTNVRAGETRTFMQGLDPACPVCPKPVREGEALGVTDEQRVDLHKVFGDLRDRVYGRRAKRGAEQDGDDRG